MLATTLTGCGGTDDKTTLASTYETNSLTDSQMSLMEAIGLGDDPSKLSDKNIRRLKRIDSMMQYLDEKYGEPFVYASYQENDLMQSEKLIVSPVSNLNIWVTVRSKNGSFTDDYDPPPKEEGIFGSGPITYYLEEQMGEFLTDILKSDYGVDTSLFFIDEVYFSTITDMSQVLENEEGGQDYRWHYSCHSTLWLPEGSITKMHIREIAVKAADWINQRHIMWQFDVRTLRQNIDFSELTRNNVFDQILIGHGHIDYLYSVDVFQERIHEYEGDSALMFDYDHEDYINGKNLWYPVYVHDVMYKREPVIEQMHWGSFEYGFPEDSFAYWVNSYSESGTLRFEELDRPLKAAGWTFYTNRENSFSWRKNNDIVRFIVEDDDEKNKEYEENSWVGGGYFRRIRCEVNGVELEDKPFHCEIVGRATMSTLKDDEFIVGLYFSPETYKELFGVVIEIDQSGTDLDQPYASGEITAIDCYD